MKQVKQTTSEKLHHTESKVPETRPLSKQVTFRVMKMERPVNHPKGLDKAKKEKD